MKGIVTVTTRKGPESEDYHKRKVQEEWDLVKANKSVDRGNGRSLELLEDGERTGKTGERQGMIRVGWRSTGMIKAGC